MRSLKDFFNQLGGGHGGAANGNQMLSQQLAQNQALLGGGAGGVASQNQSLQQNAAAANTWGYGQAVPLETYNDWTPEDEWVFEGVLQPYNGIFSTSGGLYLRQHCLENLQRMMFL